MQWVKVKAEGDVECVDFSRVIKVAFGVSLTGDPQATLYGAGADKLMYLGTVTSASTLHKLREHVGKMLGEPLPEAKQKTEHANRFNTVWATK